MIGENIKRIRLIRGYSLSKLAKDCGISVGYLSDLEKGHKSNPSTEKLEVIANALNVSINELFKENTISDSEAIEVLIPNDYSNKYKVTSKDKKQYIEEMKKSTEAFFMNDELNEEAKKEMLDLMSELFWKAKAKNKRNKKGNLDK